MAKSRARVFATATATTLIISFVLLEIVLRVFPGLVPALSWGSHGYNLQRPKPCSPDYEFLLNSRGFKDAEIAQEKAPGAFRIIGIGDSFVFGVVPYKYNFLTLLGQKLKGDGKHEVVNMGIPDTQPEDYLALLINEGLDLSPNLVMINLFLGNDLELRDAKKSRLDSYTIKAIRNLAGVYKAAAGSPAHAASLRYCDDCPSFNKAAFLEVKRCHSGIFRKASNRMEIGVVEVTRCVRAMKEICDGRGIDLIVVMIPDELQVDKALQAAFLAEMGAGPSDYDFEVPNRILTSEFDKISVKYLDLLKPFQKAALSKRLYKPQDTHWNIAGNALAADQIFCYLTRATPSLLPR